MRNFRRFWPAALSLGFFLGVIAAPGSNILQMAYNLVQDEGSGLTRRAILNFAGAGVTATDAGGKTLVTIPGAAGTLAGDASGPIGANTVDKVNGVAYPAAPSIDSLPLVTASNTVAYKNVPGCDSALLFLTVSHSFGCNPDVASTTGTFYLTTNLGVFGPIHPMSPPSAVSFSWRNQGSATVAAVGDAFYLSTPALITDSIKGRESVAPGTPWSISIGFDSTQSGLVSFSTVGMYVADNGTGKITTLGMVGGAAANSYQVSNWTNATTFSANVLNQIESNETHWFKISDDGTNLIFSRSGDGQNWTPVASVGRTSFLANPDRVGFFVNSSSAVRPVSMTLLSWVLGP